MSTMAKNIIATRVYNRPPMLEKSQYSSWQSHMLLYIRCKENVAKEIWDRVKLLIEGTELSLQEQESKLYNEFDRFTYEKGKQFTLNNKLVNNIQLKWSKFVTDVKLAKDMHESSFDRLYAYLRQHEVHANEVRMMRQQFHDPLALVANTYNIPPYYNNHQPQYNPPEYHSQSLVIPQQQFYTSLPRPYEALVRQQSYYAPVVHQWHRYAVSSLMDMAYWLSEH
ncbi:hypothetical protein Tco_0627667 [Tanacetum coccineum]|uniref:Integrase, catalytic region, zinc finger, CCHC-type, peptidase aspartic, catalytic n=1 Tax=Tanacetum coccineum TaxID=301880 RepID=A0ABQ4WN67_9ASTR